MKVSKERLFFLTFTLLFMCSLPSVSQPKSELDSLKEQVEILKLSELVQSMCQRSILLPSYYPELKALLAKQAYNFWKENKGEKYVSHLTIYSALYYANKDLTISDQSRYDERLRKPIAYNQALGHDENVTSVRFGGDPNFFYSAGSDGRVIRWNIHDITKVPEIIYQGDHLIHSIDISYDGTFLMVVSKEKGIAMIDLKNWDENGQHPIAYDPRPVQAAIFVPNEQTYISVDKTGKVYERGFSMHREVGESVSSKVISLAVRESDRRIFAGTEEGMIDIWEQQNHSVIYSQYVRAINSLSISHDQKYLAIGDEFGEAVIWDIENKIVIRKISGHSSAVTKVEFGPDDQTLLTASRDGTARIWDVNNNKRLPLLLDDHMGWVMAATYSPDGSKVVTGSADKYIRIFSTNHEALANRICEFVPRNLTEDEWREYIGAAIPYRATCQP